MKIIYENERFYIKTSHEIQEDKIEEQNIDFWLTVNGKTFSGSAFTLANIQYLMTKDSRTGESALGSYFWCADMLVVKEMTIECLVSTIENILNDESLDIGKIFTQVPNYS
ncbi:hypothetical protein GCM10025882_05400 [Acinetobacter gyllenbergii]|uniref:Uncharacterized protein n=1 Tax=Acinetobacter gyllenbergii CIP 110306 = MTCC 11365 TaxID=1217657 RepID=A0A829HLT2_9GAMM|nr:hypothetical protein [Acinetobacter gyllenbergii]EPF93142.1 hypothetical protein F957_00488 [Acinetobacter gyllenbergii CIP 110306 = MTCC 11365]ESK36816.1 hypothetical protein F987_03629 [Acinetobacter gyllenbergii NIPH 230]GMA10116.1 hypothetical protein GCM10025882_05400 [Acinetobacter gyllenbergii]